MKGKALRRATIVFKLSCLLAIVAATMALLLGVSEKAFNAFGDSLDDIYKVHAALTRLSLQLASFANSTEADMYKADALYCRGSDDKGLDITLAHLRQTLTACDGKVSQLSSFDRASAKDKEAITELARTYAAYNTSLSGLADAMEAALGSLRGPRPSDDERMLECEGSFDSLSLSLAAIASNAAKEDFASYNAAKAEKSRWSLVQSIAVILALAVASTIVFLTTRTIASSLRQLSRAVEDVGGGDFTVATGIPRGDEIGNMAACVDDLVVELRALVGTVKLKLGEVERSSQDLSANMEETGAAVIQINSNIASTKGRLDEQASAVGRVSAAVEELSRHIETLEGMIEKQSLEVSQTDELVEKMLSDIDEAAARTDDAASSSAQLALEGSVGREKIDEVVAAVVSIDRYSANLSEATRIISEIAERTNMLAMNAAIEAAHAGESGKGFAVVADEIRKLAEQSTAQAQDISTDLSAVSRAIDSVREASDTAVAAFSSILRRSEGLGASVGAIGRVISDQRLGSGAVMDALGRLRGINSEIERGAGGIAESRASVLSEMEKLNDITGVVVRNNEEITQGTRQINESVTDMTDRTIKTAALIAEAKGAADRFRIE